MKNQKKKYEKLIDNRFINSIIGVFIFTIIGFFVNDLQIMDCILKTNIPFCLWLNIKLFALILASYELFLLITNQKKGISLIGTIGLTFSGIVQWNLNNIDSLILGILIVVLIQKLFDVDNVKKYFVSFAIIVLSTIYVFTFRPYAISFGYLFLALIIWILIKNKEKLKKNKKNIIITFLLSIISATIGIILFNNNNIEYLEVTSSGISPMFSYLYNFLLPFYECENKEVLGSIISIFPVPMLLSLYYIYRNEKHVEFLLPMSVVMVFGTVYCMIGFPDIIANITLFSQVLPIRELAAMQIASFLVIFYFIGNIEEDIFNIKQAMRITIVFVCLLIFAGFPGVFSSRLFLNIFVCEMSIFVFLFLNLGDKRYIKLFLFFIVVFTLIGGIPINFIN